MSIIKMILLIGLLIFVHELGHFLVAKMFKIKVERFCFGLPFGPILFEKKIGDVTYGIHWLFFLGGYVSSGIGLTISHILAILFGLVITTSLASSLPK